MTPGSTRLAIGLLVLAVTAGLAWMIAGHAPRLYIVGNAAALIVAVGLALLPVRLDTGWRRSALVLGLLAIMALVVVAGPPLDGVRRWVAIGPVRLHAGMLLGPALAALLAVEQPRRRLAAISAALGIAFLSPDFAMALAWTGAVLTSGFRLRPWPLAATLGVAALLLVATALRTDPLEPVPFVEGVVAAAWQSSRALATALALASLAPLLLAVDDAPPARAVAGFWVGLVLASLVGAFPSPLIGYGAAPILGFGLAIAACRGLHHDRAGLSSAA